MKLRLFILLAYLPTLLLLLFIIASLVIYFSGWRIEVIPISPAGEPTPILEKVAT